ncbi:AraC family transcriptional regulator [Rhizobium tumorigenes]|uniref:AraC family transcriptional regulator n=1 Tax=Rhizobium tumorigenes TaxID=2041385 RepID=UPI00241D482A|nr:AraC family transcriptional regulator [Rhizobium tumorigenes]WFS03579.1 AraC family transcriptional regulator [Rhizobium tumorigenes]
MPRDRVDILKVTEPTELFPEIYQPLVSLILQGEKRLLIGNQVLTYAAGHTFIASVELPVVGEVVEASANVPYIAVSLIFDRSVVADLLRDVPGLKAAEARSFSVNHASDNLVDAWFRLLRLMEQPDEIAVMAPLLEREILFRLLLALKVPLCGRSRASTTGLSKSGMRCSGSDRNMRPPSRRGNLPGLQHERLCLPPRL